MIITLGKIVIDTELDHSIHKKEIEKHTHFFCDTYSPEQWFTQKGKDGLNTYYILQYNEEGDHLLRIKSWISIPHTKHMVKRLIKDDECYFSKPDTHPEEDFRMVEEDDASSPTSTEEITHWERPKNWVGQYKI